MGEQGSLGQWLEQRCHREHLSLRQAAARAGLTHTTIADIIKGGRPSAVTIKKLAMGFGGNGKQGLALEDQLLTLAGYRTPRPGGEEISESMAELIDKVDKFSEPQVRMMINFADFLVEIGELGGDR
ncbi:MAG: helix-turn-helix domain-containing protein [Dehalococcoidia bacterium]|nr:helix-turn-helix domain-containing protein [Dehalococcoidia bacterium]